MPADPPVRRNRDAERARNVARLWIGSAVLIAGIAVLRWLAAGELWGRVLSTAAAVAYAGIAWQARRRALEALRPRTPTCGIAGGAAEDS